MASHVSNPAVSCGSLRLLYSPFVTLKVGPEKREFCVHRELLCHHSKYFHKAFKNGNFEESRTGISTIENVDFRLMRIFVGWLYNGKLLYTPEDPPDGFNDDLMVDFEDDNLQRYREYRPKGPSSYVGDAGRQETPSGDSPTGWYWRTLIRLYIFADYFDVPSLCALVVDTLIDKSFFANTLPGRKEITHAFKNTAEGSRLRKFLIDLYAYNSKPVWSDWWLDMPKRFLADVMVVNMKRLPNQLCDKCSEVARSTNYITARSRKDILCNDLAPFTYDRCVYREHKTKEARQRCRKQRGVWLVENEADYEDEEGKEDKEGDEEEDEDEEEEKEEDD